MNRLLIALAATAAFAGAAAPGASAEALIPLAPSSAWGSDPMYATAPPGDSRVFVAERGGAIRIVDNGVLSPTPFLSIAGVDTSGERGLESIAFAPDFASTGYFYVFVVIAGSPAQIRVIQYHATPGAATADAGSANNVLVQNVGPTNHNGGQLAFGPDGLLYITIGENGTSSNAQSGSNLLGKVLRVAPSPGGGYTVPAGNAGLPSPEIWALGLRNPFRASFGPDGRLIIADVGETQIEELDYGAAGANYGWPTCEGDSCGSSHPEFVSPFFTYTHSGSPGGCAIIGGYYVTDPSLPALTGRYLFGDHCRGELRTISLSAPGSDPRGTGLTLSNDSSLNSFGVDAKGCVYVMGDSTAYRIAQLSSDGAACTIKGAAGRYPSIAKILSKRVRATRRGRLRVKIRCVGSAECAGRLSIRSTRRYESGGKRRTFSFGSVSYRKLGPGRSRTLSVKIPRRSLKLLNQRHSLRAKGRVTTKAAGFATRTSSKTLTLKRHRR